MAKFKNWPFTSKLAIRLFWPFVGSVLNCHISRQFIDLFLNLFVFILSSPFINPELLEIEKKTCRIASCEMVFESVAARLLHEQEFKESIWNQTHNLWVINYYES